MDIKTAFLNGFLSEEIYMDQPEGFKVTGMKHLVCKLIKSQYGLKQAPRVWYYTLYEFMLECGFTRLIKDHCVFIRRSKHSVIIVSAYVDNLLVMETPSSVMHDMKQKLKDRFHMTDFGGIKYLLGWHIERSSSDRTVFLHQEKYSTKVLDRFGYLAERPVRSPQDPNIKLSGKDLSSTPQ